jgi:hypothetical protein
MTIDEEERRLAALTDAQLRKEIDACDVEDARLELLLGESERRNLDI